MAKCPRPDKQAHPARADAITHLQAHRRRRGMGYDLEPYKCVCGAWHIGNSRTSFRKRISKALKGTPRARRHA